MSIKKVTRLSAFAGIVLFTLAFFAGTSWATESKPCKDKPASTTTTEKPKPTTTTTAKPKPQAATTTTVKQTTTTVARSEDKAKPVSLSKPTSTTEKPVEVATPEQIETTGEVNADDSIQPVQLASASAPTELAHTGAMTTRLALLGAALCAIGWVALWIRGRFAS
jgi:hypothetical protein